MKFILVISLLFLYQNQVTGNQPRLRDYSHSPITDESTTTSMPGNMPRLKGYSHSPVIDESTTSSMSISTTTPDDKHIRLLSIMAALAPATTITKYERDKENTTDLQPNIESTVTPDTSPVKFTGSDLTTDRNSEIVTNSTEFHAINISHIPSETGKEKYMKNTENETIHGKLVNGANSSDIDRPSNSGTHPQLDNDPMENENRSTSIKPSRSLDNNTGKSECIVLYM